jgi:hypothetical protein
MMRPEEAVGRAKRELAWTGLPEAAWSIVLEARLSDPLPAGLLDERLAAAARATPSLGPPARARAIGPGEVAAWRGRFADSPYREGGPAVRAAVADGDPPVLLLAGHHGAVDGLGLVALLGVAIGSPVTSSVRGMAADEAPEPWRAATVARRLREAVLEPPARVVPARRDRAARGDVLVAGAAPRTTGGTASIVAAGLRSVRGWNAARGRATRRRVVAIGASRRSGDAPLLAHAPAWLRLRLEADDDASVSAALAAARPAPVGGGPALPRGLAGAARAVAGRLGSTLLVSSLGGLSGPDRLLSVAFFPKAYGRSGVALGAAAVGAASTLTLRVRARDFGHDDAARLLAAIVDELAPRPTGTPADAPVGSPAAG